jgi:hypothetical protein
MQAYHPKTVNRISWRRVIGCGLLAGIAWIILGALVTALLGRDFAALPNNHLAPRREALQGMMNEKIPVFCRFARGPRSRM